MDNKLKEIMEMAAGRGSRYIKGETALEELPSKIAELGVFLLEKSKKMSERDDGKIKEDLIEVQNKLDDLRKALFSSKIAAQ